MATPHPDDTPNPAPAPPASARAEPATTSHGQPERFVSFVDDEKLALLSKGMTPARVQSGLSPILTLGKMRGIGDIPQTGFRMTYSCAMTRYFESASFQVRFGNKKNKWPSYPPKTIHQLLCGLLRNMRDVNPGCPNFLEKLHISTKVVPVFACPQAGERCTVYLLDLYLSKLPQEAFTQDVFYLRPLEKMPSDPNHPWYTNVPVGKNTLERKLAIICDRAGIEGSITNQPQLESNIGYPNVPKRST